MQAFCSSAAGKCQVSAVSRFMESRSTQSFQQNGKIGRTMNALMSSLLTLLVVILWGVLHSLLAGPRVKRWLHARIGSPADRGYRLFYNVIAAITLLPVLAVAARFPGLMLYQIPTPWVFLTSTVQLIAVLVIALTILQTGASSFLGVRQLFEPQASASPSSAA